MLSWRRPALGKVSRASHVSASGLGSPASGCLTRGSTVRLERVRVRPTAKAERESPHETTSAGRSRSDCTGGVRPARPCAASNPPHLKRAKRARRALSVPPSLAPPPSSSSLLFVFGLDLEASPVVQATHAHPSPGVCRAGLSAASGPSSTEEKAANCRRSERVEFPDGSGRGSRSRRGPGGRSSSSVQPGLLAGTRSTRTRSFNLRPHQKSEPLHSLAPACIFVCARRTVLSLLPLLCLCSSRIAKV